MREKLRKMAKDMDESEQMSEDVFKVLDSTQTILTSKVAGLAIWVGYGEELYAHA